jgi:Bacterial transcriptional activator domain/AAA ATPase domain
VDLDAAARLCDQAERRLPHAAAVALAAAERAAELLSAGTALADEPYATWADPARAQMSELSRRARLAAAEAALAVGRPDAAARHAAMAMAADALDEAAHRWFMSAAAAAGEPARALAAYAALRERLAAELGADPAPQTQDLHLDILRERDGGRPGRRGPAPARPAAGGRGPRLAGRDAQIAALRDAWSRAVGGDPGIVMIVGEAGIGKTALTEVIRAEAGEDGDVRLPARHGRPARGGEARPPGAEARRDLAGRRAIRGRRHGGEHEPRRTGLLQRLDCAVRAERAVAARRVLAWRAGRGGGHQAGCHRRGLHQVPACRRDAVQPGVRGAPVDLTARPG